MQNESGSAQLDEPAETNIATLFDTLSTDALSIVVKRMNRRLQEKVYQTAVPYDQPTPRVGHAREQIGFLALLFSENSPFRAAAATLVSRIDLRCSWMDMYIDSCSNALNVAPPMFEGEAKEMDLGESCFPRVVRMCAR